MAFEATVHDVTSSMLSEYQCRYVGIRRVFAELLLRLCEYTPFFLESQSAGESCFP